MITDTKGMHDAPCQGCGGRGKECFCEGSDEDRYVIERMGELLARIAIIVNGPQPKGTLWSYHDLPEKVAALQEAEGRYRLLRSKAHKNDAYDVYGGGAHWNIGIHSKDTCQSFDQVVDAARSEEDSK